MQPFAIARISRVLGLCAAVSGVLALTGCGVGVQDSASTTPTPGLKILGNVHGGAWPIQGATILLMETQNNGYGGAAKQLLSATSDQYGYFSFPDTGWTCDAGQYAYITVSGGHTSTNATNDNVIQVGVIGGCSTDLANQGEIDNVNVFVSELSTVAAAYALGNFISIDNTNAGSGGQIVNISAPPNNNTSSTTPCTGTGTAMTCTANGLAHAFGNAYNLVDSVRYDGSFPTGQANATFYNSVNAQAVVPQALINTLGNILQSCVDSPGGATAKSINSQNQPVYTSDGSHCGDLFSDAAPPAGFPAAGAVLTGTTPPNDTAPTNTLQVALNMAKYPNNHVAALFNLQPRAVFFTPDLSAGTMSGTSTPISLSIAVFYNGTGILDSKGNAVTMPYPVDVALDASDNAYVLYSDAAAATSSYGALDGFSPNGIGLFNGTTHNNLKVPAGIALDNLGNAWVTSDTGSGNLLALDTAASTGGNVNKNLSVNRHASAGVAVDKSNNVWVTRDSNDNNQSLFLFEQASNYSSHNFLVTPSFGMAVKRLVVDAAQNPWAVTSGTSPAYAVLFPYASTGDLTLFSDTPLGAGSGFGLAVTQDLKVFFPLYDELDSASGLTNGTIYTNASNNASGRYSTISNSGNPSATAIDGSGNVIWTDNETGGQVFMMTPNAGSISNGTLTSVSPCFVVNNQCDVPASGSLLNGMAIDSSGAMWFVSNGTDYAVAEMLGLAAPTWPLVSYAHAGVPVK